MSSWNLSAGLNVAELLDQLNIGPGVTTYFTPGGRLDVLSAENSAQARAHTAYTLSSLLIRVMGNTITAASTLTSRVNGAAGNQTLTIPASTTGVFEDTTNTDSISSGDRFCSELVTGGTGTDMSPTIVGFVLEDAAGDESIVMTSGGVDGVIQGTTGKYAPGGMLEKSGPPWHRYTLRVSATMSYLRIFLTTNSPAGDSTFTIQKNGVDGNMSITIPGSTTGEFEDTTNTDSFVSGDDWQYRLAAGAGHGGQRVEPSIISVVMDSTGRTTEAQDASNSSSGAGDTWYGPPEDKTTGAYPESHSQYKARAAITARNLFIRLRSNSMDAATLWGLRVNGATTALQVTIPASTSGIFEDTTNAPDVSAGDNFNTIRDWASVTTGICSVAHVGFEQRQPVVVEGGWEQAPAPALVLPIRVLPSLTAVDLFSEVLVVEEGFDQAPPPPVVRVPDVFFSRTAEVPDEVPVIESGWDQAPPPPVVRFRDVHYPLTEEILHEIPVIESGWEQAPAPPLVLPIKVLPSLTAADLSQPVVDTSQQHPFVQAAALVLLPEVFFSLTAEVLVDPGQEQSFIEAPPVVLRVPVFFPTTEEILHEIPLIQSGWEQAPAPPIVPPIKVLPALTVGDLFQAVVDTSLEHPFVQAAGVVLIPEVFMPRTAEVLADPTQEQPWIQAPPVVRVPDVFFSRTEQVLEEIAEIGSGWDQSQLIVPVRPVLELFISTTSLGEAPPAVVVLRARLRFLGGGFLKRKELG